MAGFSNTVPVCVSKGLPRTSLGPPRVAAAWARLPNWSRPLVSRALVGRSPHPRPWPMYNIGFAVMGVFATAVWMLSSISSDIKNLGDKIGHLNDKIGDLNEKIGSSRRT